MPAIRLSMRKIRDVLRLRFQSRLSHRQIAHVVGVGHSTVRDYLLRAEAAGLSWPLPADLSEAQIEQMLFPKPAPSCTPRPEPDWHALHQELRRKGMTLMLLWQEYKAHHPGGYQYSRFCDRYRAWRGRLDLVMRQEHRAGEKLFVDYAGQTALKARYRKVEEKKEVYAWCAVFYDPDRSPKEKSITLRTDKQAIARRRLTALEKRYSLGLWDPWQASAPYYGVLLDEVLERFHKARKGKRRPSTIRADESALRTFSKSLCASMMIVHIESHHIERFLKDLQNAGRSNQTCHTYATRLRKFFRWCVKEGLLNQDPSAEVEKPKLGKKEKIAMTREQFDLLLRVVEADLILQEDRLKVGEVRWMLDVLQIGIATGMRLSEICNMRWSWINPSRGEITVRRANGFVPKSGHERTISVRGSALNILERLHDARTDENDDTFVLRSTRQRKGDSGGLNPTYVSKRFLHFRRRANLPDRISFHSMRHSFCTWMIQAGVPVPTVQKLAGHADIKTTMSYIHVARQDLHDAVEAVFG